MTAPTPASFLDFFVLEASEYVEQIDALLVRAGSDGPEVDSLQRFARALRGSATMARLQSFAELAAAVESVGRALRQRTLPWDAPLKGALVATIDDFKLLIRAARTWSPANDESAMKRVRELSSYTTPSPARTPSGSVTSSSFFATEMTNIAAGLELLATRPDDQGGAINVLRRVRALRGVAGVRDVRTLPDVLEGAENALRLLEAGQRLGSDRVAVLRGAAELLRVIAAGLTSGQGAREASPEYGRFAAALEELRGNEERDSLVVAISDLYYSDGGPHIVAAAPNPPTTPAQRFRMEVVSLGEHVMRLVGEARAVEASQRESVSRDLARLLRTIQSTAESFGERAVAALAQSHFARTARLDVSALDALTAFAAGISPRAVAPTPAATNAVRPPAAPATPLAPAQTGRRLEPSTLDGAIAFFDSMASERLAEPVQFNDVVPVDALMYRGRAALDRAIELKDWLRKAGGAPSQEVLEELYDLLELARIE